MTKVMGFELNGKQVCLYRGERHGKRTWGVAQFEHGNDVVTDTFGTCQDALDKFDRIVQIIRKGVEL